MICLYAETHLSTFTLILYTCICVPFLQISQVVFSFFNFVLDPHRQSQNSHFQENPEWELDLPVSQFQELAIHDHEEMCSICLIEFEKQDLVNKLPKCGHVFHTGCLDKWLNRCQFTCPMCRSLVLRVRSSPCKTWVSPFCVDLSAQPQD